MKRIVLFMVWAMVALCSQPVLLQAKVTDTREIILKTNGKEEDPRSLLPVYVWLDGRTVYVSFRETAEVAIVSLTDTQSGDVVTEMFTTPETVSIPMIEKGKTYTIQIEYDDKCFSGTFES